MAGLFAGADYPVQSNYEYGDGRPDIVVNDGDNDRVMLFEVKHADKNETMEHALQEAIDQITKKRYLESIDEKVITNSTICREIWRRNRQWK